MTETPTPAAGAERPAYRPEPLDLGLLYSARAEITADAGDLAENAPARWAIALCEEIIYWRANTAAMLDGLRSLDKLFTDHWGQGAARQVRVSIAMPLRAALRGALAGQYHDQHCEGCGLPVLHGDLVIAYNDIGEQHAACFGAAPEQLVEGGQIPIPPECIVVEEGEDPPTNAAFTVYRSEEHYTPERIAKAADAAEAWLHPDDDAPAAGAADRAWGWWSGGSDEFYTDGPFASREEAVEFGRANADGEDFYIVEALPGQVRLSAARLIEDQYLECDDLFDGEHGEPGRIGDHQAADAKLQNLLDSWLEDWRGTFVAPTMFAKTRNADFIPGDHPAPPADAPDASDAPVSTPQVDAPEA